MSEILWELKREINEQHDSQDKFAEKIGMSKTILSGIVRGRINATAEEKDKINAGLVGTFI